MRKRLDLFYKLTLSEQDHAFDLPFSYAGVINSPLSLSVGILLEICNVCRAESDEAAEQ